MVPVKSSTKLVGLCNCNCRALVVLRYFIWSLEHERSASARARVQ